jgi:hypothetical protein
MTPPIGRARSGPIAGQDSGKHASQSTPVHSLPPGRVRRTLADGPEKASLQPSAVRRTRGQVATRIEASTRPPTRLQRALTRLGQSCTQLCRRGWASSRAGFQKLAARILLRGHRGPDGARRLRVLDQCSVAPRTRLLLVEVEGQRLLLAASGEQAPTMLLLPPAASRARKQRGSGEKPVVAGKAISSLPKTRPARPSLAVEVPRWPVPPTVGSEIQ